MTQHLPTSPTSPTSRRPRIAALFAGLLFASAAVLLGAACGPPPPFNPQDGCAKIATCEPCASRSGCGWCATSCIPSQDAKCSTQLITASNLCPGAVPPTATATPATP